MDSDARFPCWQPVLSFLLAMSIHWSVFFTHRINTLVCSVLLWSNNAEITPFIPVLAGWNLHMSQTLSNQRQEAWPTNCTPKDTHASIFFFLYFQHSTHKTHSHSFWTLRQAISLVTSCFFPFGVAMKGIHSTQLRYHISFLSLIRLTTCFYPADDGC